MGENKEYIMHPDEKGSINISEEVIAAIAANAATEIEGVSGLYVSTSKEFADLLGKKNATKGVKITTEGDLVTVDISILVKFGFAVSETAKNVQGAVKTEIESATGLEVKAVNVTVNGVVFDKDK